MTEVDDGKRTFSKRQKLLADFGDFALQSDDLDAVLTEACRLVSEAMATSRAKVLEIEEGSEYLLVRAGVGWDPGVVGELRLSMSERSSETFAIEQKQPVITQDISKEKRFEVPGFMRDAGVVALANVPILLPGGRAYGLLQVDDTKPHDFGEDDTEFLRIYATILGPVIDRLFKLHNLRSSEERFRLIVENARDYAIFITDPDDRITDWLPGAAAVFGWSPEEAIGQSDAILFTPEDRAAGEDRKEIETARRQGAAPDVRWHMRRDGSRVFIEGGRTALRDPGGTLRGYLKIGQDVTERRETEAALWRANETLEARVAERTAELRQAVDALHTEALEREQAEAQLRQAQKMEAVGQLTGGIAHDFNNMLQAIGGALELVGRRAGQGRAEEAAHFANAARRTVERAAGLTHRLLAFARRQALQPRAVNPDELVEGVAELIRHTVGPGVRVEMRLGDGNWPVLCDPHQLESVLLNLAINARDAMPDGGRLTVSTRHVRLTAADVTDQEGAKPGNYVEVAVADTGTGMDETTRARAFEPFFTTKPLGQGTGLGLSQLYGFVRQSRGVVRLDSAPCQGTTLRLYLPRHGQAGADAGDTGTDEADAVLPAATPAGGKVLLVEDEESVREVAAEHLRELGYVVLEAGDGPEALRVLQSSRGMRVDALVTDVGLPNGLNGRQLAEMAREHRPGLPVLFITGYAGGVLEEQLAPGMAVIGKPFALGALAAKVRAMIKGEGST